MSKPTRQDVFEYDGETYDTMRDMVQAMTKVAKSTNANQVGTDTITIVVQPVIDPPPPPPPPGKNQDGTTNVEGTVKV